MSNIIETFRFTDRGVNYTVGVVSFDENALFDDEWEMTDTHQGGVTVKNPNERQSAYKYAIPLQWKPSPIKREIARRQNAD